MFFNQDNDEDDFLPTKSSNLASLFGSASAEHSSKSLTYTAPKQPKKHSSVVADVAAESNKETSKAGQLSVIHASVVHVYKFEASQPVHQGKLGIALLGNHESNQYLLILYRDKHQRLANATINNNFSYTVQSNNYSSFYDDSRQSWSVNFDSEQLAIDFAKQVALMKANSFGTSGLTTVLIQELALGPGSAIEHGDSVELKYTGWIWEKHAFGQVFDSNVSSDKYLKFKVGDGKVIKGMELGITGSKLGSKRLLIIPPSLGYGARGMEPKVAPNATLIFQVELKFEGSDSPSSIPNVVDRVEKPSLPTKPSSISSNEDPTVKTRGASISEQLQSSPKNSKAKIISRMAKMGQPLLPLQGAVVVQPGSSESETEDEQQRLASSIQHQQHQSSPSPEPSPKPLPRVAHHHPSTSPSSRSPRHSIASGATVPTPQPHGQGGVVSNVPYPVYNQQQPVQYPLNHTQSIVSVTPGGNPYMVMPGQSFMGAQTDTHTPVLLAEVRAQNTELRLQVGQLSEKMERVLGKMDHSAAYPSMDAAILGHNIQRVIQENEALKLEVKEKNGKIDSQMEKISQLLQRNQKFLEQSNTMLEQRSDYLQTSSAHTQERMSTLENEKIQLASALRDAEHQIVELRNRLASASATEAAARELAATEALRSRQILESEIERLSAENEALRCTLRRMERDTATVNDELIQEQKTAEELRRSVMVLEQERDALRSTLNARSHEGHSEVRDEATQWKNKCDDLQTKLEWLQCQLKEQQSTIDSLSAAAATNAANEGSGNATATSKVNLLDEIKKIMNAVYKNLHQQFQVGTNYGGEEIKSILAATIRSVTLELIEYFSQSENTTPALNAISAEPTVAEKSTESHSEAVVGDKNKIKKNAEKFEVKESAEALQEIKESVEKCENIAESPEIFRNINKSSDDSQSEGAAFVEDDMPVAPNLPVQVPKETEEPEKPRPVTQSGTEKFDFWKPQPPPLFDETESDTDDDWLK